MKQHRALDQGVIQIEERRAAHCARAYSDPIAKRFARTSRFHLLARPTGLLDTQLPNITRFVFTDDRSVFPDWERIADERAFDLWLSPPNERSQQLVEELTTAAGVEFTNRLHLRHSAHDGPQTWCHPMSARSAVCPGSPLTFVILSA